MLRVGTLTTIQQTGKGARCLRAVALPEAKFILDNPEELYDLPEGTPVLCRYTPEDQFARALTDVGLDNLESCVGSIRDLNHVPA